MEIIFKNRPTPNIDINLIDANQTLEIIRRGEPGTIPLKLQIQKSTAIELSNGIRFVLDRNEGTAFKNEFDSIQIRGGGTDLNPGLSIRASHLAPGNNVIELACFFFQEEAKILAKALERWAKHPNL